MLIAVCMRGGGGGGQRSLGAAWWQGLSISQLPPLNILCCLYSTKRTATLLKDRFNGEYKIKILEETLKTDSNRRRAEGGNCTTRSLFLFPFKSKFFKF